jgi:hypothetical protein
VLLPFVIFHSNSPLCVLRARESILRRLHLRHPVIHHQSDSGKTPAVSFHPKSSPSSFSLTPPSLPPFKLSDAAHAYATVVPTRGPVVSTAFGARSHVLASSQSIRQQHHSHSTLIPGTSNSVPKLFS